MTDAKFPEGRKLLALYPVLLFYMSLSWMVLIAFQRRPIAHHAASAQAAQPPIQAQVPLLVAGGYNEAQVNSAANSTLNSTAVRMFF